MSRKALYEVLSGEGDSRASRVYAIVMVVVIVASLVPLCVHDSRPHFVVLDTVCAIIFIVDYIARWATADLKLKRGAVSFILYPITPMALVDLISLIPFFAFMVNPAWRALRLTRLLMALRVFRLIRYGRGLTLISRGIRRQLGPLIIVLVFAVVYVLIAALVAFNGEPETFPTYFDAIYWSVLTLTTVGYGDVYPITNLGRIISIVSSFVGVVIIALPASILTVGIGQELHERHLQQADEENQEG